MGRKFGDGNQNFRNQGGSSNQQKSNFRDTEPIGSRRDTSGFNSNLNQRDNFSGGAGNNRQSNFNDFGSTPNNQSNFGGGDRGGFDNNYSSGLGAGKSLANFGGSDRSNNFASDNFGASQNNFGGNNRNAPDLAVGGGGSVGGGNRNYSDFGGGSALNANAITGGNRPNNFSDFGGNNKSFSGNNDFNNSSSFGGNVPSGNNNSFGGGGGGSGNRGNDFNSGGNFGGGNSSNFASNQLPDSSFDNTFNSNSGFGGGAGGNSKFNSNSGFGGVNTTQNDSFQYSGNNRSNNFDNNRGDGFDNNRTKFDNVANFDNNRSNFGNNQSNFDDVSSGFGNNNRLNNFDSNRANNFVNNRSNNFDNNRSNFDNNFSNDRSNNFDNNRSNNFGGGGNNRSNFNNSSGGNNAQQNSNRVNRPANKTQNDNVVRNKSAGSNNANNRPNNNNADKTVATVKPAQNKKPVERKNTSTDRAPAKNNSTAVTPRNNSKIRPNNNGGGRSNNNNNNFNNNRGNRDNNRGGNNGGFGMNRGGGNNFNDNFMPPNLMNFNNGPPNNFNNFGMNPMNNFGPNNPGNFGFNGPNFGPNGPFFGGNFPNNNFGGPNFGGNGLQNPLNPFSSFNDRGGRFSRDMRGRKRPAGPSNDIRNQKRPKTAPGGGPQTGNKKRAGGKGKLYDPAHATNSDDERKVKSNTLPTAEQKQKAALAPISDDVFKTAFTDKFVIYETSANSPPAVIIRYSSSRNDTKFEIEHIFAKNLDLFLFHLDKQLICKGKFRKDVHREALLRLKKFCYTIRHKVDSFSNYEPVTRFSKELKKKSAETAELKTEVKTEVKAEVKTEEGKEAPFDLETIKKIIQEFIDTADPMDLVFSPDFTLDERRKIQEHVEGLENVPLDSHTLGKSKDRHLFLSRPKPILEILKLIQEQKDEGFCAKYQVLSPDPTLNVDILGKSNKVDRYKVLADLRAKPVGEDVAALKETFTIEELPFADELKGFILFKISQTNENVIKQSAHMNGKKVSIIQNPNKSKKKLLIDDVFICESTKKFIQRAALTRLEHICYTIIRKNVLPTDIKIISRATLDQYKSVDLSAMAENDEKDEVPADRKDAESGVTLTKFLAKYVLKDFKEKNGTNDFAFNNDFTKDERSFIRDHARPLNLICQTTKAENGPYMIVTLERPIQELLKLIKDKTDSVINQRYEVVAPKLEQFH